MDGDHEVPAAPGGRGHTKRQLRQLFAQWRLSPRTSMGQCFLVDLNLLGVLVREADLTGQDVVLEVGTGTGSLTQRLAAAARHVLTVEIDPGFYRLAQENLRDLPNVTLLHADALKTKNALNPELLRRLDELAPTGSGLRRKLVANLPYNVATPLLCLLLLRDEPWERFVVTVQKEVADRLVARPGTRQYGNVSVLAAAVARVEVLRVLPPSVFWPRPKVHSAIVRVRPDPAKRAEVGDLERLYRCVRRVMLHRRKGLRQALAASMPGLRMRQIDQVLAELGIDRQLRAESLDVAGFARLAEALDQHLGCGPVA